MKKELQNALCNNIFFDIDGNKYEFKCFPNNTNLVINNKWIGKFEIKDRFEKLIIEFEGGHYEVIEIYQNYIILKQNDSEFKLDKQTT